MFLALLSCQKVDNSISETNLRVALLSYFIPILHGLLFQIILLRIDHRIRRHDSIVRVFLLVLDSLDLVRLLVEEVVVMDDAQALLQSETFVNLMHQRKISNLHVDEAKTNSDFSRQHRKKTSIHFVVRRVLPDRSMKKISMISNRLSSIVRDKKWKLEIFSQ